MSPSRKSAKPRSPRKTHSTRRHNPRTAATSNPPRRERPLVRHIIALDALGWRIVELRPPIGGSETELWHVKITRVDFDASMIASATDPDAALADLVRYASADSTEAR